VLIPLLLLESEKITENFLKEDRTWSELEKYIERKAFDVCKKNANGKNAYGEAISDREIYEWVKEFYLLDELPKKPEPVLPVTPPPQKKRKIPLTPASQSKILEANAEGKEEDNETEDEADDNETAPVVAKITPIHRKTKEYEGQLSLF